MILVLNGLSRPWILVLSWEEKRKAGSACPQKNTGPSSSPKRRDFFSSIFSFSLVFRRFFKRDKLAHYCPADRIGTFSFSLDFRLVHLFWDISEIGSVDIASLRIVLVGPVAHHLVTASSKPSGGNYFRLPMFYPVNKNASD